MTETLFGSVAGLLFDVFCTTAHREKAKPATAPGARMMPAVSSPPAVIVGAVEVATVWSERVARTSEVELRSVIAAISPEGPE